MNVRSARFWLPAAASLLATMPVLAHHSFAMFDLRQSLTLRGTLKELQWTNPHCFLQVLVPGPGAASEWSVEMHSPADMYRHGWRPGSFRPGDKLTVVVHPNRDGTQGGLLVSATGPSGQVLLMPGTQAGPKP